jgi:hypothetical protein
MRVNGEPERWLLAARLSRLPRKDRERGDELINGIQTQDRRSAEWAQYEGHVIVHVTKDPPPPSGGWPRYALQASSVCKTEASSV